MLTEYLSFFKAYCQNHDISSPSSSMATATRENKLWHQVRNHKQQMRYKQLLLLREKKAWCKPITSKLQEAAMEMEMSASMTRIPNDVIIEILLRLPAKALLRLRWACKYWFDLISRDPSFAKKHLVLHQSLCKEEIFSISPYVLISSKRIWGCDTIFQCYLNYNITTNGARGTDVSNQVRIPLPVKLYPTFEILGFCNGLILLGQTVSRKFCIWNPCTKEYRMLPTPRKIEDATQGSNYGFGYDHISDDYKVIKNTYYNVKNDPHLHSDAQVYTLGTNSWRSIESNPYRLRRAKELFVNGTLYWMDDLEGNIISFDIGKEKYQQVSKKPEDITHPQWYEAKLQAFEGSLCVVLDIYITDIQMYRVEMWVMKDYGMNENNNNEEQSWTKLFTFPNLNHFRSYNKLLGFTNNGDILMVRNRIDIVSYDPKNDKDNSLYRICEDQSHFVEVVYKESLISPNAGTHTGQEELAPMAWGKRLFKSKLIKYPVIFLFCSYFSWRIVNQKINN